MQDHTILLLPTTHQPNYLEWEVRDAILMWFRKRYIETKSRRTLASVPVIGCPAKDVARTHPACLLDRQFPRKSPFLTGQNLYEEFSIFLKANSHIFS